MKILSTSIAAAISAFALAASVHGQTPVVQYETPIAGPAGTQVTNTGSSSATPGTLYNASTLTVPGPDDGSGTAGAFHFDDGTGGGGNNSTGINTGQTLNAVSGADQSFTMMAWVNLDAGATGGGTGGGGPDNMVFGTNGANPVHLGFRGDQLWFGFWGNDSNSADLGTANLEGKWNQVAWVYDGTAKTQTAYFNGTQLFSNGNHGAPGQGGETVNVGTTGNNGGDIIGSIDDARIYNTAMSASQVAAAFSDMATVDAVPEPSTWMAAGGLLLLAAGDFRRRLRA